MASNFKQISKYLRLYQSTSLMNSRYFSNSQRSIKKNEIAYVELCSHHLRKLCSIPKYSCWKCNSDKVDNTFFCGNCGTLLNVNYEKDYFQILGLNKQHDINFNDLTTKFRKLQSILHPDKFSQKSTEEQSISLDWSSLINKAYQTLSTPIKRAEYILQLNGISIPQDNSALDKEFLMDMMEINENVEEATTESELNSILDNVRKTLKTLSNELEKTLQLKNLDESKFILIKMKYFTSVENSIKNKLYKLG